METRLTLRPGQAGTKKLAIRYGERLLRVRYVYDEKMGRRLKAVELIVESVPSRPAQKMSEMSWLLAKRLGIADRVASDP